MPTPTNSSSSPRWTYSAAQPPSAIDASPAGITAPMWVLYGVLSLLNRTSRWMRMTFGAPSAAGR